MSTVCFRKKKTGTSVTAHRMPRRHIGFDALDLSYKRRVPTYKHPRRRWPFHIFASQSCRGHS